MTPQRKKLAIKIIPYIVLGILGGIISPHIPFVDIHPVIGGLIVGLGAPFIMYAQGLSGKKYMRGKEYGAARWGTRKDIKPYMDENPDNNIILTATESLTMNSRPEKFEYGRNKNILVIGGSGSGKSWLFVRPNLMQCTSLDYPTSFVVTDPKGELLRDTGKMLLRKGYKIRVLNTVEIITSMKFNPLVYLRAEDDILRLTTILMENLGGLGKATDPFWETAEKLLLQALLGLVWTEAREDEKNMTLVCDIIGMMSASEEDEGHKNAVDITFEQLEARRPDHFAVRQYKKFKLAAGKTAKSILIQLAARLSVFDINAVRNLTEYDELDLTRLGKEKTALFVIVSDTNRSYDFIPGILYSQLFNLLCDIADIDHGGRLPVHVRMLLDEFYNIGRIPNFETLSGTIRSREISACVILQSKAQLKERYKEAADTVIGNMDTELFLGGKEQYTLEAASKMMGKETIDILTDSRTRSQQDSRGENYNRLGRDLMSIDELATLKNTHCILQIRGLPPFKSKKYDPKKHKFYKYIVDKPKNRYNAKRHMSTGLKLSDTAKYTHVVYEVSEKGA